MDLFFLQYSQYWIIRTKLWRGFRYYVLIYMREKYYIYKLCGFMAVYGCIYDWVTLFTWYGHKNLVDTVVGATNTFLRWVENLTPARERKGCPLTLSSGTPERHRCAMQRVYTRWAW